jgi:hypothetical protein
MWIQVNTNLILAFGEPEGATSLRRELLLDSCLLLSHLVSYRNYFLGIVLILIRILMLVFRVIE